VSPGFSGRGVADDETTAVLAWVERCLDAVSGCESRELASVARVYHRDLDVSLTLDEVEALGREMLRRYHEQRPWVRA
jgi:hypothetical protein